MKNYLITLLSVIILISCASENEQKGLDEIAAIYHAKVTFSKGFYTKTNQKTIKHFNINVSDCKMMDTMKFSQASGNMARIAYHNFTTEEKEKYDEINVQLIKDKDTTYYSFDRDLLSLVDKKANTVIAFSESFVKHDFSKLDNLIDKKYIKATNFGIKMKKYISTLEKTRGTITDYQIYKIGKTSSDDTNMIRYVGEFHFSKGKKAAYFVNINVLQGEDKVVGYKLD